MLIRVALFCHGPFDGLVHLLVCQAHICFPRRSGWHEFGQKFRVPDTRLELLQNPAGSSRMNFPRKISQRRWALRERGVCFGAGGSTICITPEAVLEAAQTQGEQENGVV
jgi:hypothetical protein